MIRYERTFPNGEGAAEFAMRLKVRYDLPPSHPDSIFDIGVRIEDHNTHVVFWSTREAPEHNLCVHDRIGPYDIERMREKSPEVAAALKLHAAGAPLENCLAWMIVELVEVAQAAQNEYRRMLYGQNRGSQYGSGYNPFRIDPSSFRDAPPATGILPEPKPGDPEKK